MPLLFSYGTLQLDDVQVELFGRIIKSSDDELVAFEKRRIAFGRETHAIVSENGDPSSRVSGKVLEVTDSELAIADEYEPVDYKRISTTLASGREAWVYAARG